MPRILPFAFAVAGAAASALAQQFLPYGTPIMDGSQNMVTVNLGFGFQMPGGNVVTSLDVDEHGRLVEVGTDPTDASESTAEMLAIPGGSINVQWDSLGYVAADKSTVWFYTDGAGTAAVTWYNVSKPTPCTFQVQLLAGGSINFVYDSRCPADDAIVGVCPGNGATLPAQSDLSTAAANPLIGNDPTVFEDFANTVGVNTFDLPSTALQFIPNGPGWLVIGTPGVIDPPPAPIAANFDGGGAMCPFGIATPVSYTFTPNGNNYDIVAGPSQFDPTIGADAGATADDTITAQNLDLTFAFPWPGGLNEQIAKVDPNGRILPQSSTDAGDYTPTVAELTSGGKPCIAVFWTDMNVAEPGIGRIRFHTVPGVSATFTWDGVKQFDTSNTSAPMTFQVTLYPSGQFVITHQNITAFNRPNVNPPRDLLVGCGTGAAPVPGEIDLTALSPAPLSVPIGNVYEFWSSSTVEPTDLFTPLPDYQARLVAVTEPMLGTNWEVQVQGVGASAFGIYFYGTAPTRLDLAFLGSPCHLLVTPDASGIRLANGLGDLDPVVLAVPNTMSLDSAEIFVQAGVDGGPTQLYQPFAGLPFRFSFTNAFRSVLGQY